MGITLTEEKKDKREFYKVSKIENGISSFILLSHYICIYIYPI